MTTFQSIVFGAVHGISEFLPLSSRALHLMLSYLVDWPEPSGVFSGALSLGALLALVVFFRHDLASMASSVLRVIIFRKRPMTLDERLPLFITIASLPVLFTSYYFHEQIYQIQWTPLLASGLLAAFGLPFWISERLSRGNKGIYDWSWSDAIIVGVFQILMLVPGCGLLGGIIPASLMRNYNREAAVKFGLYCSLPILFVAVVMNLRDLDLHAPSPMPDLSWLSFAMAFLVTFLCGLLAIGGLMKNVQKKGFGQYIFYRIVFALTLGGVYWFRVLR